MVQGHGVISKAVTVHSTRHPPPFVTVLSPSDINKASVSTIRNPSMYAIVRWNVDVLMSKVNGFV